MKWLKYALFFVLLLIFFYFRITPILDKTVPYTYDQGRDFLKIEEIFRDKNITFIGPTTGIQGVFHGVWWYYFLIIPYLVFSGWPQGFYFALFLLSVIANLGFFWFLKKNFNVLTAFFFLAAISISTFFIRVSFFASNNILSAFFILLLIFSVYKLFEQKRPLYLFSIAVSLGFIFESEMALGFFVIPSFIITFLLNKEARLLFKKISNLILFAAGLLLPMVPRLLFELKNNFSQTKSFLKYLSAGKNEHPVQFVGLIQERLLTFWQSWRTTFYKESLILSVIFFIFLIILLLLGKKLQKPKKDTVNFLVFFVFLVFIFTLSSRNNFFWSYYLDGIQYIYIFLVSMAFYLFTKIKKLRFVSYLILFYFLVLNFFAVYGELSVKKNIPLIGLRADDAIIKYILDKNQKQEFCLRIYTPPIFPFTYRYLLDYYTKKEGLVFPKSEPVKNHCWYIIDYDEDKERVLDWRKKNISEKSRLIESKQMENKSKIELWNIHL